MKTNQIFSLKRFINLIKSDLLINYKKYLLMVLVMSVLGYAVLYMNMPKHSYGENLDFDINKYLNLFITFIIFSLGAWIGSSFPAFNNKNTRRNYIMSPSSTFEKYSAQFLGRVIISLIIFLIIFWIDARLARFTILNTVKENVPNIAKFTYSGLIERMKMDSFTMWFLPLITSALFMFVFAVRIYFNKRGLIKTVLSMDGILFCVYLIFVIFTQMFYPTQKLFEVYASEYKIGTNFRNTEIIALVILAISTVILPVLGFFKLKEKEL